MNVTATDVLNSLFNPSETVCFRVFEDRKDGIFTGQKLSVEVGKFATIEKILRDHNEQGHGIFFVVNSGGQSDKEINRINAQFVESDSLSFEEMQARIDGFPLPPSMIIKTRKSLHTYWFVKDAEVARFRPIQKALVDYFAGDPNCVNESRVLRLQGFNHYKKEPVMVECVSFHPERRYTQDQLWDILPHQESSTPVVQMKGTEKGLAIVLHSCDFLKHCRDDAATLPEHDWYAMITNLASFEGGTALIHEMSAPYPDYNENGTQKKINHFLESGTKPITCKVISEKGFKCPKFAAGECQVKSPAALCYRPMNTDGLMEILEEISVTGETLKDLQAAKDFVTDYLFNQDVVIADVMINAEIRDHFKLRATFLKSLNLAYKEASRKYQSGKEAKRAQAGTAVPDWYEPTKSGLRFLPGVLAKEMSDTQQVFYAAEQHFCYRAGGSMTRCWRWKPSGWCRKNS